MDRVDRVEDDGAADPRLVAALAGMDRAEVLAALVDARVFAAITATALATEQGAHGLTQESHAELALALLEAPDGRRALPVFTDLAALRRWRLDVRPVPLTGPQACAAARDEHAVAVVIDPAGPAFTVTELATVADGFVPVPGSSLAARRGTPELLAPAQVDPSLVTALREALRGQRLRSARLLQSADGLVVGVSPDNPLAPTELAALAQRLVTLLGPALPPGGLDLVQVPPDGPGIELLRKGRLRLRR